MRRAALAPAAAAALLSVLLLLWLMALAPSMAPECGRRPRPMEAPPPAEDGRLDLRLFHVDASGNYKVVPFAAAGPEWPADGDPVCLATHASAESAHSLLEALAAWAGPASVSIFDPDPPRLTALVLDRLRACSPRAYSRTAFHAIIPAATDGPTPPAVPPAPGNDSARGPEGEGEGGGGRAGGAEGCGEAWPEEKPRNRSREFLYPQNLARNTARQRCSSEWVLTVDADMVPPPSLSRRLAAFLRARGPCSGGGLRCAYVLPTYEVVRPEGSWGRRGDAPDTKAHLLRLKAEGKARQFHSAVFQPNQGASQLSKWEARTSDGSGGRDVISVAHQVRHFPFWYEPVYVSRRGAPLFDERFVGYGMTRNTQAYEMFLRGYTFHVLDNAFLIHWGLQEREQRPPWREKQSRRNYGLFQKWILEKSVQYDADPSNLIDRMGGDQRARKVGVAARRASEGGKATPRRSRGDRGVPVIENKTEEWARKMDNSNWQIIQREALENNYQRLRKTGT